LRITKAPETEPQSAETGPSPRPALEPGHSGREDAPVDESAIPASPEDGPKPQSEIHPCLAAALNACRELVPKKAVPCWPQLIKTIAQLEAQPIRGQPSEMIELVLEAGYQEYLQTTYENFMSRREDLTQLASFALQFRSLEEFLAQLSLLSNLDAEDHTTRRSDEERIRLSTIHQAKGLEFDVVFIIMLCDGLFPTVQALDQMDKLEEERRLFYVAITRARNELYLSYPYIRMARGSGANKFQAPSRFLDEIPEGLWEQWNVKPADAGH
jgi:DNA helicase-2/ATP-dependent DNA helicase PcrA